MIRMQKPIISLQKRSWKPISYRQHVADQLAMRYQLDGVSARILSSRLHAIEDAPRFLEPSLRNDLPDPSGLADMDKAASIAASAIEKRHAIAIWGDYDVDGTSSTALLLRLFHGLGTSPELYIPDRFREGYGPNNQGFAQLIEHGVSLVIMADCGTSAHDVLQSARARGVETIVLDHHVVDHDLPPANAIVNPKRDDDASGLDQLAAVGISFMFAVALVRTLRLRGFFTPSCPEPDLRMVLDLVALGTVCDVVPLTGINRTFVTQGLKIMNRRANSGLARLCTKAGLVRDATSEDLAFAIGPRINAGARIGEADLAARLLAGLEPLREEGFATDLDAYNQQRKQFEQDCLQAALGKLDASDSWLVWAASDDWHPGVIGIVASRLRERYDRPALVFHCDGELATGSGRSFSGIDLGQAVLSAKKQGLLLAGGGHAMAAGFTVQQHKIKAFCAYLVGHFKQQCQGVMPAAVSQIDAVLPVRALTGELRDGFSRLEPFGAGNHEPKLMLNDATITRVRWIKDQHIACLLGDRQASGHIRAIAFRAGGQAWGDVLSNPPATGLYLYGRLSRDNWQGREDVQFMIEDVALP
ncbi:MAG: single-stranded-DNA-specific exonuclease RecJ [Pseudomonadota bacterium]